MLFALGAVSSAMDALQSLLPSKSSAPSTGTPFALSSANPASASSAAASGASGYSQLSPATMSALLAAQGQSSTSQTSTSPASTLQSLFSQIDGNDDGEATMSPQAATFSAATASYNFVGQMVQRQPLSFSA
jgi:hypothetical protein